MRRLRGLKWHMGIYKIITTTYDDESEEEKEIEPTAFINLGGEYYAAEILNVESQMIVFNDTSYCQVILANGDVVLIPEKNVYKQFLV